jgi:hypothetical protein
MYNTVELNISRQVKAVFLHDFLLQKDYRQHPKNAENNEDEKKHIEIEKKGSGGVRGDLPRSLQ